jgi:hypothetical protein
MGGAEYFEMHSEVLLIRSVLIMNGSGSGSVFQIRIQIQQLSRIRIHADPNPQSRLFSIPVPSTGTVCTVRYGTRYRTFFVLVPLFIGTMARMVGTYLWT